MVRGGPSRGLLLRAGALLTALCVCLHVYLERGGARSSAPLPSPPTPALGQPPRRGGGGDRAPLKRRVSYVRSLKKDPEAGRRAGLDGGLDPAPAATCCPQLPLNRKTPRWHIDLEPWASESRSLEDEARRFLDYITTPQVSCSPSATGGAVPGGGQEEGPWAVCLDSTYSLAHRIHSKHCRVYSLGLGVEERGLERWLAAAGCEVHVFDPGLRQPHLQSAHMWLHRLSVDWRDPNPAIPARRQHANTKKLAAILNDFGHRQVDVLKADMESAEWKILENLVLEGVLGSVGQLLLELHLHWAGFEVGGDEPAVVRYWFSLLRELERAHFRLFRSHSDPARPRLFLHRNVLNASSAYTLGWVNTQWRP